jgi:NAD(P)-dependent dehydrogenase (short-subunit alcohol dehydrogenase family)
MVWHWPHRGKREGTLLNSLAGTLAVVTGGARGIGRGIARALLGEGAAVVIASRTRTDLDEACQELSPLGQVTAVQCDVSDSSQVARLFDEALRGADRLDALVCAHGVVTYRPFLEISEEQWDRTLAINLKGAFLCGQAAAAAMVRAGRPGRIVFISSINGLAAEPESADYSASKAGLHLLARGMACDLARYGITVNVVAPGWVRSPMSAPYLSNDVLSGRVRFNPVGRVGEPADIGNAVAWLLREQSSYVTGAVLPVDGGQSAVLSMPSNIELGEEAR